MSIERLQSHWGFSRMPFGRNLAPSMLHRHPDDANILTFSDGQQFAAESTVECVRQEAQKER
jgi:type II secretory pathway predicted ATPase ExeA